MKDDLLILIILIENFCYCLMLLLPYPKRDFENCLGLIIQDATPYFRIRRLTERSKEGSNDFIRIFRNSYAIRGPDSVNSRMHIVKDNRCRDYIVIFKNIPRVEKSIIRTSKDSLPFKCCMRAAFRWKRFNWYTDKRTVLNDLIHKLVSRTNI